MYFYRYVFPTKVTTFFSPQKNCDLLPENSPQVKEFRPVLDSTPWILDSRYLIPVLDSDLDFGFQSLVRFQVPRTESQIPKSRIRDSTSNNFPDSRIPIPLHGAVKTFFTAIRLKGPAHSSKQDQKWGAGWGQAVQNGCYELLNGSRKLFNKR